jgi:hypothetical protein
VNVDPNWFDGYFEEEWLDEIALKTDDERLILRGDKR